ncbi:MULTISPECIES: LysR family transcriptional regulator [Pseudomonas]|uniref:LysR family transcriptional regulator n=1 Tax=Pseudomonas TaxID=286 RepID=UPI000811EA22|nr:MULTISPECIES: LysR family transcriptional regulator [unclassified Pseudomonas]MBW8126470.1 LysR family transcriptional regulator [Pseudomonas sp. LAP_36]MBW8135915.1 LysR family transcriptional regulator [Pseudomonas sp. PAMC 26818]CRM61531.1 D-malate degradation protein R [Pseudomonas sp. 24 E 1]
MDRLTAMETFVHVVETGSFSAAAKRLGIGQPAVSKSIAQLETRLAVRLVLRSTRGLTTTEAGLAFFEKAKRAIDEANAADDAARGAGAGLTGNLRISAPVTFARMHIIPHLGPFLSQFPELNVDVVLDDRSLNLVEEGIDVALRMGNMNDSSLTARKIGESPCIILGTPRYFERFGEPATPADLLQHEAIIYTRGEGSHWTFTQGDIEYPLVAHGRVRVTAAEGVRAAVLSHLGLTLSSTWMFAPELASGEVKRVLTDWTLPPRDLWAVFPTGRMASAKARAFVEYVEGLLL